MLTHLWNYIDHLKFTAAAKFKIFRLVLETGSAVMGLLIWLVLRNWWLKTWDWMFCFIGYPILIALFVSIFYSCNHDFCNGGPR